MPKLEVRMEQEQQQKAKGYKSLTWDLWARKACKKHAPNYLRSNRSDLQIPFTKYF